MRHEVIKYGVDTFKDKNGFDFEAGLRQNLQIFAEREAEHILKAIPSRLLAKLRKGSASLCLCPNHAIIRLHTGITYRVKPEEGYLAWRFINKGDWKKL